MIRVYSAMSLDGFLAGENGELDWLGDPPDGPGAPGTVDFPTMLSWSGAMIMGRSTYDTVRSFDAWPYGDLPVLVPTHRALDLDAPPTIEAIADDIGAICARAQALAGDKDVYIDGGQLISQALDAGLIDELILTIVPVLLGKGIALYQGAQRHRWRIERSGRYGPMMQLVLRRD